DEWLVVSAARDLGLATDDDRRDPVAVEPKMLDAVEEAETDAPPPQHLPHRRVARVAGASAEAVGEGALVGERGAHEAVERRSGLDLAVRRVGRSLRHAHVARRVGE